MDNQRQQDEEDYLAIGAVDDPEFESFGCTDNLVLGGDMIYETTRYRNIKIPTKDEMDFLTRRSAPEQLNIQVKLLPTARMLSDLRRIYYTQ